MGPDQAIEASVRGTLNSLIGSATVSLGQYGKLINCYFQEFIRQVVKHSSSSEFQLGAAFIARVCLIYLIEKISERNTQLSRQCDEHPQPGETQPTFEVCDCIDRAPDALGQILLG